MKIYEVGVLLKSWDGYRVSLDGRVYDAVVGKHAVWISEIGVKLIWSHCGRIESYRDWEKGRNFNDIINGTFAPVYGWDRESLESIVHEYVIMKSLSEIKVTPPVGDVVFIKKFISNYPYGVEFCDLRGRYGYQIEDATQAVEPGKFTRGIMKKRFGEELEISDGAIGDLYKEDNIINGYLVDVRRTLWDMMKLKDLNVDDYFIEVEYDAEAVMAKVHELGQFPFKERRQPYQTYYMCGNYQEGSRDTEGRFKFMEVEDHMGSNVVDLGCAIGSMATEAYRYNAVKVLGVDSQMEFVDCARDIAMVNGFQINFVHFDLTQTEAVAKYIEEFFCGRVVDVVFALSLFKHIKFKLFDLLKVIDWKYCYIESNNAPEGLETDHVKQIVKGIHKLQVDLGSINPVYLGMTQDRSPRCVWRLERGFSE